MNPDKLPRTDAPPAREPSAADADTAPKAAEPGKFAVPRAISDVAIELGRNFGLSPDYLVAACLATHSGAIGNSVRLRCRLWPRPLNGALQWLFVDRTTGGLASAIDFITQDLAERQEERLRVLNVVVQKKLEEQIQWNLNKTGFGYNLETGSCDSNSPELARLQLRLQPLQVMRDPPPGQLADAVARSGDQGLLALYSPLGVHRLCTAPAGKFADDLLALEQGWEGQTLITLSRNESDDLRLLEPAVSCLLVCGEAELSRLLETEPLSHAILGRMMPMGVAELTGSARTPGFSLESLRAWRELIQRANYIRESGYRDLLPLAPEAEASLMEYRSECQNGRLPSEEKFLGRFGPVVAAKLSLGYQLALSPRPVVVSVQAMEYAIQLTRVLLRKGADSFSIFPGFGF